MKSFVNRVRWIAAARTSTAAVAQTLVSRAAIILINLGTGVIVARSLGPAGRGAAAAASLWPIIFCGVTTFGIPTALRYYVRRSALDQQQLFTAGLLLSIITGILALSGGILLIPSLLHQYPLPVIHFALLMMLFAPQIMCNNLLQAYLEATSEFTLANVMQYTPPATTLIVLIVLQLRHSLTVFSVPLAYFMPTVVVTVLIAFKLRRSIRRITSAVSQARTLLHYGVRAYGLNILTTLSGQIDQAIIIGFMSAASFGLYGIALNIAAMLGIFAAAMNTVLFPRAAELEPRLAIEIVCRSGRVILAISLLAYVGCLALTPVAIHLLYGQAYDRDITLVRVLMIEVVLSSTSGTFAQAFMATGRPGLITILQGVGVCTAFPLMLVLIPRFGLLGAAYALVASTGFRFSLILLSFPLILKRELPRIFLSKADVNDLRLRFGQA